MTVTIAKKTQWQTATWEDYLNYRDAPTSEEVRLFFNGNYLFVDMGSEVGC